MDFENYRVMEIPLHNADIKLRVKFREEGSKRYLLEESIIFDDICISDYITVERIKVFINKCNNNTLRPSKYSILEYKAQNIKDTVTNKLFLSKKIVFSSKNGDFEISDIDCQAILNHWKDILAGFSKVYFFDGFVVKQQTFGYTLVKDNNSKEFKLENANVK
jgi:hypothetical protein